MNQTKPFLDSHKTRQIGLGKSIHSRTAEDGGQRHGTDPIELANANAMVVYLAGKDLTSSRPLDLIAVEPEKAWILPAGSTLTLLEAQPLQDREIWEDLEPEAIVLMEYQGDIVMLSLQAFHDAFCITDADLEDAAF